MNGAEINDAASSAPSPLRDFNVFSQRLDLEISFVDKSIKGKTDIYVIPTTKDLKTIRLNCRQCEIKRVMVEGKVATFRYRDPYKYLKPHYSYTVHQYHFMQDRLEGQMKEPAEPELIITVPRSVTIQQSDTPTPAQESFFSRIPRGPGDISARIDTPTIPTAGEGSTAFAPLKVEIQFETKNVRDGLQFVEVDGDSRRYPHVYTHNSAYSTGKACAIFPCVDDVQVRCPWEITIKCPKTVKDAFTRESVPVGANRGGLTNGLNPADGTEAGHPYESLGLSEEELALDMIVVCCGELSDEAFDAKNGTKKTMSFTCSCSVSANQIGFAIGPFENIDLSTFREVDEDEKLGSNAIGVHAYCLPGRANEVRNTCMPMAKAIDFCTTTFTTFPFSSYSLCFVDDLISDVTDTAALSICSNRLLFPEDIIDPLDENTRILVRALTTQYSGVAVTAKESIDYWVILGIACFMGDLFMKQLAGNNEYRYRQKLAADKILELDVNRPSLHDMGLILHLDPSEVQFTSLKAGTVLFILDRRLTKSSGSAGVTRIIARLLSNAKNAGADETMLSTAQFQRTCEKIGHTKLDAFFLQWVANAGCPQFLVTQRFNKKKLVVEMLIKQVQIDRVGGPRDLDPDTFMRDVKEDMVDVYVEPPQPVFTGPMTIRIHEADGTPYEHIVEIKEATTKFEIPYNTKYKRLKRSRRQKERTAAATGVDVSADAQDDVLLYCLGDVLQSEEEVADWRMTDWSKEDEDRMSQESYEWIRMDADFEWICKMNINMPPYMFVSQLQQDRDVVAQIESLQYMDAQREHPLISTILTRTLMDHRYFHGIREMAAAGLAKCAKDELDWIGLFHLEKVFQELFCLPGSPMTKPNDFSDRQSYLIQCAIPKAISNIKDNTGQAPMGVKRFFIDKMKFNDNTDNEFSDSYYVATLMSGLAETLTHPNDLSYEDQDEDEEDIFQKEAINEIERYRRIDEWISTYHNVYCTTGLDCLLELAQSKVIRPNPAMYMQYTRPENSEYVRIKAMDCLTELGMFKNPAIQKYFFFCFQDDPSPYMRENIGRIIGKGLAKLAIGDKAISTTQTGGGGLIIEQDSSTESRQEEIARRQTVDGATTALRGLVKDNNTLKEAIWSAVRSDFVSMHDLFDLLDLCQLLFKRQDYLKVELKYPRYWRCEHVGRGVVKFKLTERVRTQQMPKPQLPSKAAPVATQPAASPSAAQPKGLKRTGSTNQRRDSNVSNNKLPTAPITNGANASPTSPTPPPVRILKLKTKSFSQSPQQPPQTPVQRSNSQTSLNGSLNRPMDIDDDDSQPLQQVLERAKENNRRPSADMSGGRRKSNSKSASPAPQNQLTGAFAPQMSPPPRPPSAASMSSTASGKKRKIESVDPQSQPSKKPSLKLRLSNFGTSSQKGQGSPSAE